VGVLSLAPLVTALVVVGLLVLVTRWVFRPARPNVVPRRPPDASEGELGLLTVVLSGVSRQDVEARRAVLDEAGIRSSVSKRRDGTVDVLVFSDDAEKARIVLGP
jgi:hypothetical protein